MGNLPESVPQQPVTAFLKRTVSYVRHVAHVNGVEQLVTRNVLKESCELCFIQDTRK